GRWRALTWKHRCGDEPNSRSGTGSKPHSPVSAWQRATHHDRFRRGVYSPGPAARPPEQLCSEIGIVERCENFRFTVEAVHWCRITREFLRQDFYRDITLQLHVEGAIDLSHPAAAKEGRDFV